MVYKRLSQVPEEFRAVAPVAGGVAIQLNLSQANALVVIFNGLYNGREGGQERATQKAKSQFRQNHVVKGGKWMKAERKTDDGQGEVLDESSLTMAAPINEVWAKVAGSFEDSQRKIMSALRGSKLFGAVENDFDLDLEATFPDSIVVRNSHGNPTAYYQADWKANPNGSIAFSNITPVQAEVVIKAVNEQETMMKAMRESTGTKPLNELMAVPMTFNEVKDSSGNVVYKASVETAQVAENINGNDRFYAEPVLMAAVDELKEQIATHGPLPMDYKHRTKTTPDGRVVNETDLMSTVAVIKAVNYNKNTKTVSLDEIEFTGNAAGRDMVELFKSGLRPQVSQRAMGKSQLVRSDEGKVYENVTALKIKQFDFVPPGEASVKNATVQFQVLSEGLSMNDAEARVLSAEETEKMIAESGIALREGIVEDVLNTLKENGLLSESEEEEDGKATPETGDAQTPPEEEEEEEEEKPAAEGEEGEVVPEAVALAQGLQEQVSSLKSELEASNEVVGAMVRADELAILRELSQTLMSEELETEPYARFSDQQKAVLLESVDPTPVHGTVDLSETAAVKDALSPLLATEVGKMDKIIAATKLDSTGYPLRGTGGGGLTHVTVTHEAPPNGEYIGRLSEEVEKRLSKLDIWRMPDDHPQIAVLNEMMSIFYGTNHRRLMNEANEEVTQLDIGARVASIAAVVIPAAFRRLTALPFCDAGTQTRRIEDAPIAQWLPAETGDIADDIASIEIAEGGTIPTAGIKYTSVPIIACRKALRTFISSEAKATARGTSMTPEADAVAGLALDVQRRVDRLLWQLMITKAQLQATTEVTSYETLTRVGSSDEFASVNQGWMNYEHLKTYDANSNPTGSKLGKLYAGPTGNTLQDVDVREGGGDNTAMTYGTDYTVNWPDGTITLTAAGWVIEAGNGVEAKYTYTTNARFWSVVPPTGLDLYNHLINLRQMIGQAKVLVANRHYAPNVLAMSFETEDLVTSGPQFTAAGATASDMLDRLNNVTAYAGLTPVKTSAISQAWILLLERGSCVYRVHTPWGLRGPVIDKDTGDDYYLAEEYSGYEVPVMDKLVVVGVTDINTV